MGNVTKMPIYTEVHTGNSNLEGASSRNTFISTNSINSLSQSKEKKGLWRRFKGLFKTKPKTPKKDYNEEKQKNSNASSCSFENGVVMNDNIIYGSYPCPNIPVKTPNIPVNTSNPKTLQNQQPPVSTENLLKARDQLKPTKLHYASITHSHKPKTNKSQESNKAEKTDYAILDPFRMQALSRKDPSNQDDNKKQLTTGDEDHYGNFKAIQAERAERAEKARKKPKPIVPKKPTTIKP